MLDILIRLYIAQAIGDIALQTKWQATYKSSNKMVCFVHASIVAGVHYILIPKSWLFFTILLTHYCIDWKTAKWKGEVPDMVTQIDVGLHMFVSFICFIILMKGL